MATTQVLQTNSKENDGGYNCQAHPEKLKVLGCAQAEAPVISGKRWSSEPKLLPEMPMIGLGLWKSSDDEIEATVYEAIKMGYRHLDGACAYGNERAVGKAIKRALDEGICERKHLWITSKLWNAYHRTEHVPTACQKTLDDLGLEYLDLYLIHTPLAFEFVPFDVYPPPIPAKEDIVLESVSYRETWEAMEALQASGKVKHIGVSNIGCHGILDILSYCKVKPVVNQVECHVYLQQTQLVEFCQSKGIQIQAYSPFGAKSYFAMGLASEEDDCFNNPVLKEIAAAKGKTVGDICLRFQIQRGVSVLPKSVNIERLRQNMVMPTSFELSAEEMTKITALERNRRFLDFGPLMGIPIFS